jgi:predicted AlkP superfamily phosphohydrolase/phosphomutase
MAYGFTRRDFIQASLASAVLGACTKKKKTPVGVSGKKTVILGFDGVDPRLVQRWMAAGMLPHLKKLAQDGCCGPLASTSPPNSPVAWSTFATGVAPAEHGIFGFLRRDPKTYLPGTAPYAISGPRFDSQGVVPAKAVSHRIKEAWWDTLDAQGVPVDLLFVPYVFPPPLLRHGRVLSGLGTPDARFTNSSFTLYTSEATGLDKVAGGRIVRLSLRGNKIDTELTGPRGPGKRYLATPLALTLDRSQNVMTIATGGRKQTLKQGQQSDWFPVSFETGDFVLAGRVRFILLAVRQELRLYASPIQLDPARPALPFGAPAAWVEQAVLEHSLPTVGWVHDTSAVNAGVLPKEVFLRSVLDTMQARSQCILEQLASQRAQVTCAVFTGTDRAAHLFYSSIGQADGGPLARVYQAMDSIVGQVRARLDPACRLVVMSDHGFHAFDRMLHVNTWLESVGLLHRLKEQGQVRFLRGIDWSKTKAYGMGNGQLYVNQKGREGQGWVDGAQGRAVVLDRIKNALLDLRDPKNGQKLVKNLYPVADQCGPQTRDRAPDLQIAFAPGYRSSWATSLGGAPPGDFLADNPKAWCGDHAASDVVETPGILLSNEMLKKTDPNLIDLPASLLASFGAKSSGPGKDLWS